MILVFVCILRFVTNWYGKIMSVVKWNNYSSLVLTMHFQNILIAKKVFQHLSHLASNALLCDATKVLVANQAVWGCQRKKILKICKQVCAFHEHCDYKVFYTYIPPCINATELLLPVCSPSSGAKAPSFCK